jgi:hypothetical protein
MSFAAAGDLAMILPLPVPPRSREDAVRFVSLEGYDEFFQDVSDAFPVLMLAPSRGGPVSAGQAPVQRLVVHDVGDFEASFVPTLADFDRLDPRFKLDPKAWEQLPQYGDWGFAVFKLKQKAHGFWGKLFGRGPRKQTVHPMAFEFPRRDPRALFFPTVHIHDGEVHETARFDHTLYCQPDPLTAATLSWERSAGVLGEHLDAERSRGLVDLDRECFRAMLVGTRKNRDLELIPPKFGDASRLSRRSGCFELRLRASTCFWDDEPPKPPASAEWKRNAADNLETIGEQLVANLSEALEARRDELGLCAYDDSLRIFGHVNGRLRPQFDRAGQHRPVEPGESILLELSISDHRVEPQHVRIALAEPPTEERIHAIQAAANQALARVELPMGTGSWVGTR